MTAGEAPPVMAPSGGAISLVVNILSSTGSSWDSGGIQITETLPNPLPTNPQPSGAGSQSSGGVGGGGGTLTEGPYEGYGPQTHAQSDNVEEDLAGWWKDLKDWMKSWFERTKPAQDIATGIADQAIPGGEFKDAAEIALEGAKTGIKLKALRDLQRSQSEEAGGIGSRNGNDTDARWKDYHDVTGKESLRQLDPGSERGGLYIK